jgi:hypothetical protein
MEAVAFGIERYLGRGGEDVRRPPQARAISDPDNVAQRVRLLTARSSRSERRRSGSSASSCVIT